jgi:hypothetical protein
MRQTHYGSVKDVCKALQQTLIARAEIEERLQRAANILDTALESAERESPEDIEAWLEEDCIMISQGNRVEFRDIVAIHTKHAAKALAQKMLAWADELDEGIEQITLGE